MTSYLGTLLEPKFKKAIDAGKKLADLFLQTYEDCKEESITEFVMYIHHHSQESDGSDGSDPYQLCCEIMILPKEILEKEIGLSILSWSGSDVELFWTGE